MVGGRSEFGKSDCLLWFIKDKELDKNFIVSVWVNIYEKFKLWGLFFVLEVDKVER